MFPQLHVETPIQLSRISQLYGGRRKGEKSKDRMRLRYLPVGEEQMEILNLKTMLPQKETPLISLSSNDSPGLVANPIHWPLSAAPYI